MATRTIDPQWECIAKDALADGDPICARCGDEPGDTDGKDIRKFGWEYDEGLGLFVCPDCSAD